MAAYVPSTFVALITAALVIRAGFLAMHDQSTISKGRILILMPFVAAISYAIAATTKAPRYDNSAAQSTYETAVITWFAALLVITIYLLHRTRFDRETPVLHWVMIALCLATGMTIYTQFH